MIYFNLKATKTGLAVFYNEWDVDGIVLPWRKVIASDTNKFVKFTDGSNLYAKVLSASPTVVVTSAGIYRRFDIIHAAIPKDGQSLWGIRKQDVHPAVYPFRKKEYEVAIAMLKNKTKGRARRRVRMLIQQILKKECVEQGFTKEKFVDRMIQEFNIREGRNFPTVAKFLGIVMFDMDITKKEELPAPSEEKPLMLKGGAELHDSPEERKVISLKDLKNFMKVSKIKAEDIDEAQYLDEVTEDEEYSDDFGRV